MICFNSKELHIELTVYQTQRLNEIEWRHPTAFALETSGQSPCHGNDVTKVMLSRSFGVDRNEDMDGKRIFCQKSEDKSEL